MTCGGYVNPEQAMLKNTFPGRVSLKVLVGVEWASRPFLMTQHCKHSGLCCPTAVFRDFGDLLRRVKELYEHAQESNFDAYCG